jgi:AcrR family transcriptional regulator
MYRFRVKRSLLDVVAEVFVADPGVSLAAVAEAVGISRTTLHNHYATRDDLLSAVGNRVLDLWEEAVRRAKDGPDGGLAALSAGRLAPPDAPGRVLDLFLHGIGTSAGPDGGSHAWPRRRGEVCR